MRRFSRFIYNICRHGDVVWLTMMIASIVFALTSPWYFGIAGFVAAIFYYDMAMEN